MKSQVHLYKRQFLQALFSSSKKTFHSDDYLRHNSRRLEHLASLGLPIENKTVLEVGAGIGDHTSFYLDRGCQVLITEGRQKNLEVIRQRFPNCECMQLNLEKPDVVFDRKFDIVHCYGLLYHLGQPLRAIEYLSSLTNGFLVLETCVSREHNSNENIVMEPSFDPSQALTGKGCRPSRTWLFNSLKQNFKYVYVPLTQPCHEQFPLDWSRSSNDADNHSEQLTRAVFIGSNVHLNNPNLVTDLPQIQSRTTLF